MGLVHVADRHDFPELERVLSVAAAHAATADQSAMPAGHWVTSGLGESLAASNSRSRNHNGKLLTAAVIEQARRKERRDR